MANHVTTKLTIEGPSDKIEQFVKMHVVINETEDRELDFNTVVPMLEAPANTSVLNQSTDEAMITKEATGCENWYDWRCANWGTEWNAYHFSDEPYLPGDSSYTCSFDTAWSYPQPVFEALTEMHPSLRMEVAFYDEMGNFAGHGQAADPTFCEATDELHAETYGMEPGTQIELEVKEPARHSENDFDMEME